MPLTVNGMIGQTGHNALLIVEEELKREPGPAAIPRWC